MMPKLHIRALTDHERSIVDPVIAAAVEAQTIAQRLEQEASRLLLMADPVFGNPHVQYENGSFWIDQEFADSLGIGDDTGDSTPTSDEDD